jgi:hypothetical protein
MVTYMKEVAKLGGELTVDERNLLSVAYKNVVGTRRASWRIISSIEQKEESKGSDKHVSTIKEYRSKIELELEKVCQDVLDVLDESLIPNAATGESKVFYHKMYVFAVSPRLTSALMSFGYSVLIVCLDYLVIKLPPFSPHLLGDVPALCIRGDQKQLPGFSERRFLELYLTIVQEG